MRLHRLHAVFGTFEYAYPIKGRVSAFMPPQGILVVAAYLPKEWEVRFVDENIRPTRASDFAWADAVFVSGMQLAGPLLRQGRIEDVIRVGLAAHHSIIFATAAAVGAHNAAFYSPRRRSDRSCARRKPV